MKQRKTPKNFFRKVPARIRGKIRPVYFHISNDFLHTTPDSLMNNIQYHKIDHNMIDIDVVSYHIYVLNCLFYRIGSQHFFVVAVDNFHKFHFEFVRRNQLHSLLWKNTEILCSSLNYFLLWLLKDSM